MLLLVSFSVDKRFGNVCGKGELISSYSELFSSYGIIHIQQVHQFTETVSSNVY